MLNRLLFLIQVVHISSDAICVRAWKLFVSVCVGMCAVVWVFVLFRNCCPIGTPFPSSH